MSWSRGIKVKNVETITSSSIVGAGKGFVMRFRRPWLIWAWLFLGSVVLSKSLIFKREFAPFIKWGDWILSGSFQLCILVMLRRMLIWVILESIFPFGLLLRKENECILKEKLIWVCYINNAHLPWWSETLRFMVSNYYFTSYLHICEKITRVAEKCNFSLLPESVRIASFACCTTFIYNFRKKKINNETLIINHIVTGFHIPLYKRLIYLSLAICWHLIKNQKMQKWVMASWVLLSLLPFTFMAVSEREGVSYPNPLIASNRGNEGSSSKPKARMSVCCGD